MRTSVLSVLTALTACTTISCTTADKASTGAVARHAVDCAGASLALEDTHVLGTLDGKTVTFADLGKELASNEQRALHAYCDAVHAARSSAFDSYVTDRILAKAAAGASKPVEEFMADEVKKHVVDATDAEIQAFYDTRKRADAPPLEEVKGQIAMLLSREKSEEAVRVVLEDLRKGVSFTSSLPDVRSPPRDVAITAHTASKGKKGAAVRVVEFADFQCPYCSQAAENMRQLEKKYGDRVEFAYRHFPLRSIHPDAQRASEFAQCAGAQGNFWPMHDKLYASQSAIAGDSLRGLAEQAGVDMVKLDECLASGRGTTEVNEDFAAAEALGVGGTPTFFIGGRQHVADPSLAGLSAAIDEALRNPGK